MGGREIRGQLVAGGKTPGRQRIELKKQPRSRAHRDELFHLGQGFAQEQVHHRHGAKAMGNDDEVLVPDVQNLPADELTQVLAACQVFQHVSHGGSRLPGQLHSTLGRPPGGEAQHQFQQGAGHDGLAVLGQFPGQQYRCCLPLNGPAVLPVHRRIAAQLPIPVPQGQCGECSGQPLGVFGGRERGPAKTAEGVTGHQFGGCRQCRGLQTGIAQRSAQLGIRFQPGTQQPRQVTWVPGFAAARSRTGFW